MAYGPHAGERPASMWQWPAFADITAKPDWKTFAFHQGNFGAGYPKPTRLLIFAKEGFKLLPDTQSRKENETPLETAEELADTFPICQPEGDRILGGFGPPRICDLSGGPRDFHDGGGLCSSGRWPPDRRSLADSDGWSWLRNKLFEKAVMRAGSVDELEREVFRMAAGGEEGCRLVRKPAFHQGAGRYYGELDRGAGLGVPGFDRHR